MDVNGMPKRCGHRGAQSFSGSFRGTFVDNRWEGWGLLGFLGGGWWVFFGICGTVCGISFLFLPCREKCFWQQSTPCRRWGESFSDESWALAVPRASGGSVFFWKSFLFSGWKSQRLLPQGTRRITEESQNPHPVASRGRRSGSGKIPGRFGGLHFGGLGEYGYGSSGFTGWRAALGPFGGGFWCGGRRVPRCVVVRCRGQQLRSGWHPLWRSVSDWAFCLFGLCGTN